MEGHGVPAHQVWLPPLAEPQSLDTLLPAVTYAGQRGFGAGDLAVAGALRGVVGNRVTSRSSSAASRWWLDLSGAAGNVVVVGGPQTARRRSCAPWWPASR